MTDVAQSPFEMNGRQKQLYEALAEPGKDPRLADMYLGALITLSGPVKPDGLAQACHSLRELMQNIPELYATVPAPERLPRMDDKVRDLARVWAKMREKSACLKDGNWCGVVDRHLQNWLGKAEEFFAWIEKDRPMRKQRTTEMLRALDPMQLPLPGKIVELRVEEWSECREFFVRVAHHDAAAKADDVSRWVYFLEVFLLDLIRPRTFEKHDDIDKIIAGGEQNADD